MLVEHKLQYHAMLAAWWLHAATNGHSEIRGMSHGDGTPFTPEDHRDDAMETSSRHIELFHKIAEEIAK